MKMPQFDTHHRLLRLRCQTEHNDVRMGDLAYLDAIQGELQERMDQIPTLNRQEQKGEQ